VTTKDTYASMAKGFHINQAPKTFRDAILLTHRLGIHLLWIDSLGIIQFDWQLEGSRMAQVYGNASLTISATNSDDDSKGFLNRRPLVYGSLKMKSTTGHSSMVYLNRKALFPSCSIEPLDRRCWNLQEQCLSRRTVRFCENELVWICKQHIEHESGSSKIPRDSNWDIRGPMSDDISTLSWESLVETYSQWTLS